MLERAERERKKKKKKKKKKTGTCVSTMNGTVGGFQASRNCTSESVFRHLDRERD